MNDALVCGTMSSIPDAAGLLRRNRQESDEMDAYIVDKTALRRNVEICRREMGQRRVYAVVKGDGYGLGLAQYSRFLMQCGVDCFAVTEPEEAQTLRQEGFGGEILMLRCTSDPQELEQLLRAQTVCTVGSEQAYDCLEKAAQALDCRAKAHVYIDSGMAREGFAPYETEAIAALCRREGAVCLEGIYTHFPNALSEKSTRAHFKRFERAVAAVRASGWQGIAHCAASIAALRYADMRFDAVRLGSALLGRVGGGVALGLCPVGYIQARIAFIRPVKKGEALGYGSAWRARKATRVAVLNVGYYHGVDVDHAVEPICFGDYLRAVVRPVLRLLRRQRKEAVVAGARARILGRVAMQNTMVDVTGVDCAAGECVTVACNPLMVRHLPRKFI